VSAGADKGNDARRRDLGAAALVALALIWGYGWVLTKVGLDYMEPYAFAALRSVLSVLCLFGLLLAFRRPLRPVALGLTVLVGLLQTSGFIACTMWALAHTGAGKTAVLTYTMPFWLLLLAWAFLGERVRGLQWPAVGLALVGLILVIAPWQLHGVPASLMAVAGGLCWAGSAVVVKIMQRRHEIDVLSLTAWQMLLGTPVLVVIAAFTFTGMPTWSPAFAGVLAFNVLVVNGIAWFLWLFALHALSAGGAGIGTLAVPVVGVVAAWIHLGERPAVAEAIGMAFIIAALGILSLREVGVARQRRRLALRITTAAVEKAAPLGRSGTLPSCSEPSPSTSGTRSSSTSAAASASDAAPTSSPPN
jgi:drug/metabolite transporter (DMT)-like permease